jgi:subtilisin-like proprotein convertase family protein
VDVNVTVDISHSYVGQLSAKLIAPDGTPVELFGNVGGSGENFSDTVFDDGAVLPITSGTAPFTATFHPEGSLADFNGLNALGTWTLEILDNDKGDIGTLNSWSLEIAAYELSPNAPPVADAGGTYSGNEDVAVSFDASRSNDPDGSIVEYTWDFGDGTTPVTRSSPTIDHTYLWGDTFAVTLTVLDDRGGSATDSTTATITEVNDLPVADPGGPYNGTVAQAVNFDGSNSSDIDNQDGTTDNDQTLTYSWDFGDGSDPESGETVSHAFAAAGTYTVTLTVGDGIATDVQSTTVDISDEPFATTMHVSDLDGKVNDLGRFWEAEVTITVLDDSGAAVRNATVYGTWSGDTSGSASVMTDINGQAIVVSDKVLDKKDMVVFTVDDILDPSPLTYESADNTDPDDDSDGTTIIVLQSSPASLLATDNFHATVDAETLTRSQAEAAAREALALWSWQPGIALPRDVHVQIADLPGNTLGWASGSMIVLDHNANGAGWEMDVAGSTGRVDLLTVVSHEIGHLLGYEHNSDPHDVMAATLPLDTRRLPGLESIFIQPVTVNGHSLELKTDIAATTKSLDPVAEANFDVLLAPLVMDRAAEFTGSPEAFEGRMLNDILDEETELVEEELLDLLLS